MSKPRDRGSERRSFARHSFKDQLADLFRLHSGERRGNAAVVFILVALALGYFYYRQYYRPKADMEPLKAEMQAWLAQRDSAHRPLAIRTAELFAFDPNTIGREDWLRLGLSEKQITGIERYQAKGGRFRVKSDLGRMYTIRPEQYEQLKPFIQLPDSSERNYADRPKYERYERDTASRKWPERRSFAEDRPAFRKVEVNTADTLALIALPGIGPSFARGIVKYRESLGGYLSLDRKSVV